jgi:hypothetical protein
MNERIDQLAEQATSIQGPTPYNPLTFEVFDKEKFAELIVRECGLWFNNRLVVEPDYGIEHRIERNRAVINVMKEFNQHFGVES